MASAITVIATIWLVSLLPFLLLAALLLSMALIPVTRRLRREMEEAGFNVDEPRRTDHCFAVDCSAGLLDWSCASAQPTQALGGTPQRHSIST